MDAVADEAPKPVLVSDDLSIGDLILGLSAGWRDFLRCPAYGIFFAAIFVAGGWFLTFVLASRSAWFWLIPAAAGFPLLAPFAAAGLYEISKRRLSGEPITWPVVLGAVRNGDGQLPVMGVIAFVIFSFWVILAHTVFGVFLGQSGLGADPLNVLLSPAGLGMLAVGSTIGAIVAFFLFTIMVVSLPMLIDREVDFITAIITSVRTVRTNLFVMISWAVIVAAIMVAAMLPGFVGLFLALPLLGHATFHLYRRIVR